MKKQAYFAPAIKELDLNVEQDMLAISSQEIPYAGKASDIEGDFEVDTKQNTVDVWE